MDKETLRMQMLSGVITEGQYKAKLEEATQKDSLNEHYVAGGIVGIGAINQIPSRTKAVYEDAFEHFLGQKYGLNEVENLEETETGDLDPAIKNDPNFKKLVNYFNQHPDEAEEVKDEVKKLEEVSVKKSSDGSFYIEDGVYNTYYDEKNGKYFKREDLEGGKQKTTEISKEEYKKVKKEYIKTKLVNIGLSAAALGFVGALMAGPLGTYSPDQILDSVAIAAGIGATASAALSEDGKVEEKSLYEDESPTKEEIAAFEAAVDKLVYMTGMSKEDAIAAIGRVAQTK
jgi:hypothetical protein